MYDACGYHIVFHIMVSPNVAEYLSLFIYSVSSVQWYLCIFFFSVLKEEPEDLTHLAPSGGDTCVPLLDVPNLFHDLNEDTCIPQDVSKFIPNLDDIFTLDYQMPIASSDALISSEVPDNTEEQENSQDYLYDENKLIDGFKCINR